MSPQILYMFEYNAQTEACFEEAGFPSCWGSAESSGKYKSHNVVDWDMPITPGCGDETAAALGGLGDCAGLNSSSSSSAVQSCSDVEWPG